MPTPRRGDLQTIQALRAVAALLVVAFHAVNSWSLHVHGQPADAYWPNGSGGVDIFFVISGLVMVISADRVAGKPGAWRIFLRQRLVRVVPLYWIMTTVKVATVLALPALALHTDLNPRYVAGSYLFLPVHDATGDLFPVLPVGWTLNYEMLFYGLVALGLLCRLPVITIAGPVLAIIAVVGVMNGGAGFANTIVVEFIFGVLLGAAMKRRIGIPPWLASILLLLGLTVILIGPVVSGQWRPITWGVPSACIVAGAVALEGPLSHALPRWLLDTGDASYSIYLTHLFLVPVVYGCVSIVAPAFLWLPMTIVGSLIVSAATGRLSYLCIERPLLRSLRRPSVVPAIAIAG
ncbi:MAG TPA: acyltransferase [Acetobacteraceae bacterium]|jgi:exopolysaccharide production protein ExoZ|nr:acyltransferase [Acetobacteraceae bacterium]